MIKSRRQKEIWDKKRGDSKQKIVGLQTRLVTVGRSRMADEQQAQEMFCPNWSRRLRLWGGYLRETNKKPNSDRSLIYVSIQIAVLVFDRCIGEINKLVINIRVCGKLRK